MEMKDESVWIGWRGNDPYTSTVYEGSSRMGVVGVGLRYRQTSLVMINPGTITKYN